MVMLTTLLMAVVACTLLYVALVRSRYRLETDREYVATLNTGQEN
jgi:hypothetical protein